MVKKMKIASFFKNNKETAAGSWAPSSCKYPKTHSFRAGRHDDVFKTVNSVFFDDHETTPAESWFTNSLPSEESSSFSTELEDDESSLEIVLRGVKSSERLFFEPGGDTRSIIDLEKVKTTDEEGLSFNESSVVLAMESENPYADFRKSMEEMVESHGLKDWECLEELLGWYLKMNADNNHGFIVDAFVDLLVGLTAANNNSCSYSRNFDLSTLYSSAVSSLSSCSLSDHSHSGEIQEERTTSFLP